MTVLSPMEKIIRVTELHDSRAKWNLRGHLVYHLPFINESTDPERLSNLQKVM